VIDFTILQQDGYDDIDAATPLARQRYMANTVLGVCERSFSFDDFEEVGGYFRKVINLLKQMNYQVFESDRFKELEAELQVMLNERGVAPPRANGQSSPVGTTDVKVSG